MAGWWRRLERADDVRKSDKVFVLSCVRNEGLALQVAPPESRADPVIVEAAVAQNGLALRFASRELRNQRDLVLAVVQRTGLALEHASLELRKDEEVVLAAIRQDGLALEHAAKKLRADINIVLEAVSQNGEALEHARTALRNDRDVVLAAVSRCGCALQFASEELRADPAVCRLACRNDPRAVDFIDDPAAERRARMSMIQDVGEQLHKDMQEELRRTEQQWNTRIEQSEGMLQKQPGKAVVFRKRGDPVSAKIQGMGDLVSAWGEKVAAGGKMYRMIEGWKDENIPKIKEQRTLDLGDPWERKGEKPKPVVAKPAQPAQVMMQGGGTRTTMSVVRREVYSGPEESVVREHLFGVVQQMTGSHVDVDNPLMESGIDSLAAVELRQQLQKDFKISLTSAVMFNFPTVASLAEHLVEELTSNQVPGWGQVTYEEVMEEMTITDAAMPMPAQQQVAAAAAESVAKAYQGPDPEMVKLQLSRLVESMTGSTIDMDFPLMESGIDSLASVELRQQLQKDFTIDLPSTVMFNYPTMEGLSEYITGQLDEKQIEWGR